MKILVIQTAFIGDVILATSVLERLHAEQPGDQIDFLVRKGNEPLFAGHPFLNKLIIWDKKSGKLRNLFKVISEVKRTKYDKVINLHRFATSGLITFFSGSSERIGFDKNPFSFCYTKKVKHVIGDGRHEVDRNNELIDGNAKAYPPKLYPQPSDYELVKQYKGEAYICIAPSSVWFTKQYPAHKWVEFLNRVGDKYKVYLLGAGSDAELCNQVIKDSGSNKTGNLAGKLSFLQSAALMKDAVMNYTNDSSPMHLASAVNAPVTAIFCSTIPAFGFGPLSTKSFVVETVEKLDCRPCGLHGYKACPKGHFKCAETIKVEALINALP